MKFIQVANGDFYLLFKSNKCFAFVTARNYNQGKIRGIVGGMFVPEELIGKKVKIKLEVV